MSIFLGATLQAIALPTPVGINFINASHPLSRKSSFRMQPKSTSFRSSSNPHLIKVLPISNNKVLVVGEDERLTEAEVTLVRRQGNDVLVRSRELRDAKVVAERSPVLGSGIKVRVIVADGSEEPEAPAMVKLDPERRAKLIAFLEANKRIPKAVKKRMLNQLAQPEVPSEMVERLESRMGG